MRDTETRIFHHGGIWSAFVALSSTGIIGVDIIQETAKSENFFDFLGPEIVPQLQPFPGRHSILDNLSGHLVPECVALVENAGAFFMPLPPYSPDLNPVELGHGYAKTLCRQHDGVLDVLPARNFLRSASPLQRKRCMLHR